jgi:hypothetical protein
LSVVDMRYGMLIASYRCCDKRWSGQYPMQERRSDGFHEEEEVVRM